MVSQRDSLVWAPTLSCQGVPLPCSGSLIATGAKTCRGETAEFLVLHSILESQKFLRLGDVLPSALNCALLGYSEGHEIVRSDLCAINPVYIKQTVAAELSGVLGSREVNPAAGVGEWLKHEGFSGAFGVNACETRLFTSAFRVQVWCDARMVWSFAISIFPHQVWVASLIFTRDEWVSLLGETFSSILWGKSKKNSI